MLGDRELQSYPVNEIQEVYRLQGVGINDKHRIPGVGPAASRGEVRPMMRWGKVEDVRWTEFLIDEHSEAENECVLELGLTPAKGRPLLLGITKASPSTDSFISAASFQAGAPGARVLRVGVEVTTRVLTEASISGKVDHLRGDHGLGEGVERASERERNDVSWSGCRGPRR